uniref:Uncharacterized protein n=1 Tax=Nelumbo nucifera TaxID=4432 RepID=A0A822XKN7_NELNU|nr:TPA_asm: hypothetical protein HUJ06_021112 [Nelumbo nucifera]
MVLLPSPPLEEASPLFSLFSRLISIFLNYSTILHSSPTKGTQFQEPR